MTKGGSNRKHQHLTVLMMMSCECCVNLFLLVAFFSFSVTFHFIRKRNAVFISFNNLNNVSGLSFYLFFFCHSFLCTVYFCALNYTA